MLLMKKDVGELRWHAGKIEIKIKCSLFNKGSKYVSFNCYYNLQST